MRFILPFICLLCTSFLPVPTSTEQPMLRAGKDTAVFFAVQDYKNWDKLKYPIADAQNIGQILDNKYGFTPRYYNNATQDDIEAALTALISQKFAPDAQLLLFFTGHGDFNATTKEGYFIPQDARIAAPASYCSFVRLQHLIKQIPCNHILLAIDACYSGTFDEEVAFKGRPPEGRKGEYSRDARDTYIEKELQLKTRLFIASGKKERTPDQSEFAFRFKRALQFNSGEDNILAFAELTEELRKANPRPYFSSFEGNMDESNFLFIGPKPVVSAASVDKADWEEAKSKNTVEAYELYKKKHQQGDFVEAADAKIALLRTDNMLLITGGTFQMGSEDGESDEKPVHSVTVSDFYLSKYEVTVAEFRTFINDTGYKTDAEKEGSSYGYEGTEWKKIDGRNWRHDPEGNTAADNHPVINVSWNDAVAYCEWMSKKSGKTYRLPTEAEWEYAAGNGSRHTKYSWGNGEPSGKYGGSLADETGASHFNWTKSKENIFLNYTDGFETTAPVGSFNNNDFGLYDMTGNVWEWCSDWYGSDYYKSSPARNPTGPTSGSDRVVRGGSWLDFPQFCRVANRNRVTPGYRHSYVGFRLARTK